jgi:glycosyltransferase involved in cell wall biosynthesis
MRVSILIPTYNNLNYLKFFINSIKKNSYYKHQIILHINEGSDGTLKYAKKNKLEYTYSISNIGLCSAINRASKLVKTNYILYAHDDMFFCKKWDLFLKKEVKKFDNNLFYLTGTNVSINNGLINYNCGSIPKNFNEKKFNQFCKNDKSLDLQGSHWAPHLIHKEIWEKIGGFSEEFNPGDGSDPDFCMKLWKEKVRVFKTISKFKVYHFSSVTTRKSGIILNNGTKTFTLKYGFNPRFFRKYYLRGDRLNSYKGELKEPKMNFKMFYDYLINKLKFLYYKI